MDLPFAKSASSPNEAQMDPNFVRALFSLELIANPAGLPDEFSQPSAQFRPALHALNTLQMGKKPDLDDAQADTRRVLNTRFDAVAPFISGTLPDVMKGVSMVLSTLSESTHLVDEMEVAIQRDAQMLGTTPGDLRGLYYRNVHLTEAIDLLDRVDEVVAILPRVQDCVASCQIERASEILMAGLDLVMSSSMVRIRALEATRNEIVRRRNSLFDFIVGEIAEGVYCGHLLTSGRRLSTPQQMLSLSAPGPAIAAQHQSHHTDPPQRLERVSEGHISERVRALKIIGKAEWLSVLEARMPAILDAVIAQVISFVAANEANRKTASNVQAPTASATPFGTTSEWQKRLPSITAPKKSVALCIEILEELKVRFVHCLHNHVFLLSKSPELDPEFTSLKRLWFCIETKAEEVFDALTLPPEDEEDDPDAIADIDARRATAELVVDTTATKRKTIRLRRQKNRKGSTPKSFKIHDNDEESKDFSFLVNAEYAPKGVGNFAMLRRTGSSVQTSLSRKNSVSGSLRAIRDAVKMPDSSDGKLGDDLIGVQHVDGLQKTISVDIPEIVPSVYNVASIHGALQRLALEGWRIVSRNKMSMLDPTESVQHLNMFAEEAVCVTLFNELWSDLQAIMDLLSGRPRELLKMESLTQEDENAAMAPLPAANGVLEVIAEVIEVASNLPDYAIELGRIVGDFLGIFEDKLYISLGVIEQWTVTGVLLEEKALISELQQTLRSFFSENKESSAPAENDFRRSSKDKVKVKARFKTMTATISALEKDQQQALSTDEFKALVRLVSSVYHLLRLMDSGSLEQPDTRGGSTTSMSQIADLGSKSVVPMTSLPSHNVVGGSSKVSNVLQRHHELQRQKISKRVAANVVKTLQPAKALLQRVAERGLILLRLEIQSRILLHLQGAIVELSKNQSEQAIENLGSRLGSDLSGCDRIVKFNLDVAKREYIFFDLDFTVGALLEHSGELLKANRGATAKLSPSLVKAMRAFISSARRHCDMLSWGARSAINHSLDGLERTARGL